MTFIINYACVFHTSAPGMPCLLNTYVLFWKKNGFGVDCVLVLLAAKFIADSSCIIQRNHQQSRLPSPTTVRHGETPISNLNQAYTAIDGAGTLMSS